MTTIRMKGILAGAIAVVGLMLAAAPAAQAQNFATYSLQNQGTPFKFTSTSNAASLTATSVPVTFSFLKGKYAGQTISANLMINATTTTKAMNGPIDQPLINQNGSLSEIKFTANGDQTINGMTVTGGSTLLDVNFTGSLIQNLAGTANLVSSVMAGDTLMYSSQYLRFGNNAENSFSLGLTVKPATLSLGSNGFLKNFSAGGSGPFAGAVVPEPSTALLMGLGLLAIPAVASRRRRLVS